jgi:N-acetylmuramoyl-L-alanine amidase
MSKLAAIVVHHAAAPRSTTVEQIRGWHKVKGWSDIGYHYLLRQPTDASIPVLSMGRPHNLDSKWEPWEYGAHAKGNNSASIGLCLVGNFDVDPLPAAMRGLLVKQLVSLCSTFRLPASAVKGHKEMPGAATACPGRFVDLDALRADVAAALPGVR